MVVVEEEEELFFQSSSLKKNPPKKAFMYVPKFIFETNPTLQVYVFRIPFDKVLQLDPFFQMKPTRIIFQIT
jgi:hypothetical protein